MPHTSHNLGYVRHKFFPNIVQPATKSVPNKGECEGDFRASQLRDNPPHGFLILQMIFYKIIPRGHASLQAPQFVHFS